MNIKTAVKIITPQWADDVLKTKNPTNRKISDGAVQKLCCDMRNGTFVLTHQGIAFDEAGDLIDGQHRLAAVVKFGKPVEMNVTTGLPSSYKTNGVQINTFEVVDSGSVRRTGAMLQMAGYRNANKLAAAVRNMMLASADVKIWTQSISTPQIHKALAVIGDSAERVVGLFSSHRMFSAPACVVAAVALYHTVDQSRAEQFAIEVGNISGGMHSPSRALVTWIKRHPQVGGCQAGLGFKAAASALESFNASETLQKVYSSESSFAWLMSRNKPLVAKLASLMKA